MKSEMLVTDQNHRRFTFHLGLMASIWLLIYLTLGVWYQINDDNYIAAILKGHIFATEPSPWVYFVNIFLSYPLSIFYSFVPNVDWYLITLAASIIYTTSCLVDNVRFRAGANALLKVFEYAPVALFIPIFFTISYTMISILATLAGVYLFTSQQQHKSFPIRRFSILLCIGCLWRPDGFLFALAVSSPLILHFLLKFKFKIDRFKQLAWLITPAIFLLLFHLLSYQVNSETKNFLEFNNVRVFFNDQISIDNSKEHSNSPLSQNDIKIIENWFYLDRTVFNKEILLATFDIIKIQHGPDFYFKNIELFLSYLKQIPQIQALIAFFIFGLLLSYFCGRTWGLLNSAILFVFVVAAITSVLKPVPFHILIPSLCFYSFVLWQNVIKKARLKWLGHILFVFISLFLMKTTRDTSTVFKTRAVKVRTALTSLDEFTKNDPHVYVSAASLSTHHLPVFESMKTFSKYSVIASGWLSGSPINEHKKSSLQIDSFMDDLRQPHSLLIADNKGLPPLIVQYYLEHEGLNVDYTTFEFEAFSIYRFNKRD